MSRFPFGFQFTIALAVAILAVLVALGTRADTLPFPPNQPYSDAAVSHYPAVLHFQRAMRNGDFPHWRNLIMSGQPFAANPLNKVYYPPQWIALTGIPAELHLNVLLWAHLTLAGVGMFAFMRRIGIGAGAAAITGFAYALTPRLWAAAGAGHADVVYALAWFPVVLFAVDQLFSDRSMGTRACPLAASATMCLLADLRMSLFVFVVAGAYGVYRFALYTNHKRSRLIVPLLSAMLLTVGFTAIQWLPLLTLGATLSRGTLDAAGAGAFSLNPLQIFGLIIPRQPGSHETQTYLGVSLLISVIIGIIFLFRSKRRGFAAFWLILAAFAAWYALGLNGALWTTLLDVFPALAWFRVPSRVWIVVIFALIVLAGFGIEALARATKQRTTLLIVVGAIIALDLIYTDSALLVGRSRAEWLDPYTPIVEALREENVTRFYSPSYSVPQQVAAYYDLHDFGGIDPFQLRGYVTLFSETTMIPIRSYTVSLPPFDSATNGDVRTANRDAVPDLDLLGRWNVSHVVSAFPMDVPDLELVRTVENVPDPVYIYENTRRPAITVEWQGANCYTADSPRNSVFQINAWFEGWLLEPSRLEYGCYETPDFFMGTLMTLFTFVPFGLTLLLPTRK